MKRNLEVTTTIPSSAHASGVRTPFVDVRSARKIYKGPQGDVEAVSEVSFQLRPGEFASVVGPSGCGKSTLLMMICGLEAASGGSIAVDGIQVTGPHKNYGLVFQDATLLPWKTSIQNVLFPIQIMRLPMKDFVDRANRLLEFVGLSEFKDKKPSQLSGGMKQRVAICRALIHDPQLLLMDEPFSALDAITRDEMNVALADIWQQYTKTGIFITHSIREAVFLSDRVLVMTKRPSTIVADITIPFGRPRHLSIMENVEFNKICGMLRQKIEESYRKVGEGRALPPLRQN